MAIWRNLQSWFSWLPRYRRQARDADLARELRDHLELEAEEQRAAGLSPKEAANAAHRALGNTLKIEENVRAAWGFQWLETLAQDVRFAFRMLRKSPGFTAVAVLTLALGIGANTAIFSLINSVMLRELPVRDPGNLYLLRWHARGMGKTIGIYETNCLATSAAMIRAPNTGCSFSYPMFQQIRAQQTVFSGVAAFAPRAMFHLTANGSQTVVNGYLVSGDFFPLLGIRPAAGRTIAPSDDVAGAPPVAVLSYRFWQREFLGDPRVVGKVFQMEDASVRVVGIAPTSFTGLDPGMRPDIWVPFSAQTTVGGSNTFDLADAHSVWLEVVARTKPGIKAGQAASAATVIFARTAVGQDIYTPADSPRLDLMGLSHGLFTLRHIFSHQLFLLMGAVGFVLFIACANIAGLTLARADSRRKEIAVRLALGAGRGRAIRQLLTESMILAIAGGAAAIAVGYWCANGLAFEIANSVPFARNMNLQPRVDWHVLSFAVLTAALAGIIFGLAPALRGTHLDLTVALKSAGATSGGFRGGRRFGLGGGMVMVQIALTVTLLAGAGLLVRTVMNVEDQKLGFDANNVLLFSIEREWSAHQARVTSAQLQAVHDELPRQFAAIPGVISTSYSITPLMGGWSAHASYSLPGAPRERAVQSVFLDLGPNFFTTMRIPILAGRDFSARDLNYCGYAQCSQKGAPEPVIINQALARALFGTASAIGREFVDPDDRSQTPLRIIGVVADTEYKDFREGVKPICYGTLNYTFGSFELRTGVDPLSLIPAVRAVLKGTNLHVVADDFQTQKEAIAETMYQEQLFATLAGLFALVAMALACLGIYGLLAYEVGQRTPEIGLRIAIGASPRDILRMVLGQGVLLAFVGIGVGIGGALALMRFLRSLLFEIKPTDPATFIGVAILLALVALAACYIPARRATRVDPMVALRYE